MEQTVRELITRLGVLQDSDALSIETDLYDAGMSSHASVKLMFGLEDAFDIEFPDEALERQTFASIQSIVQTIRGVQENE
ncbi:MAG: acyl carrier protein [Gammaproteobacteria bacterium]|nr:acyl carrier protein [Gammaproteobacteria bacterium]